jgi:hypothetical protein
MVTFIFPDGKKLKARTRKVDGSENERRGTLAYLAGAGAPPADLAVLKRIIDEDTSPRGAVVRDHKRTRGGCGRVKNSASPPAPLPAPPPAPLPASPAEEDERGASPLAAPLAAGDARASPRPEEAAPAEEDGRGASLPPAPPLGDDALGASTRPEEAPLADAPAEEDAPAEDAPAEDAPAEDAARSQQGAHAEDAAPASPTAPDADDEPEDLPPAKKAKFTPRTGMRTYAMLMNGDDDDDDDSYPVVGWRPTDNYFYPVFIDEVNQDATVNLNFYTFYPGLRWPNAPAEALCEMPPANRVKSQPKWWRG